ncbi:esterase [Roseimaritima multifibrata]|uniref:Esterase n=1 Tax=Roseimaritima multifibrata TaxID=1930274 RepID=A0A517MFX0_9BACT|nr:hypothetical protein [Roseimaritima multifibrata]QDS93785.1 esterase [Roseimaritima multifibrata]
MRTLLFLVCLLSPLSVSRSEAAESLVLDSSEFSAEDSLKVISDPSGDATACLSGLAWPPGKFMVQTAPPVSRMADALISFPSPVPSGDARNDRVTMEWHAARDKEGKIATRPAVVVVHESGSKMAVGRLFAMGFQASGVHAFLIHLPYYGERLGSNQKHDRVHSLDSMIQAVTDVRRARDAVAALPFVEKQHVSVQGTSLGGFVAATSASLDSGPAGSGYENVFVLLAGGNLIDVIQSGKRDAAKFKERLLQAGFEMEQIRDIVYNVEPLRIAHRLNPKRTWMFTANQDQVVPLKNALALAERIGLEETHHFRFDADHYSGIYFVPIVLKDMVGAIEASAEPAPQSSSLDS